MKTSQHLRASIATYLGVEFFPLSPRWEDIYVEDIAHALANNCRYNGHVPKFYSVAQHCVHVSAVLEKACIKPTIRVPRSDDDDIKIGEGATDDERLDTLRWGLLHDAAETYLPDVCGPIKPFLIGFDRIEEQLLIAMSQRFGLPWPMPEIVKAADRAVLFSEARSGITPPAPWWKFPPDFPDGEIEISPWDPETAEARFLDRFIHLFGTETFSAYARP
jgi:hypothetical protein